MTDGLRYVSSGITNIPAEILGLNDHPVPIYGYFAFGIPASLFGAFCVFFAHWIVRLSYRDSSP